MPDKEGQVGIFGKGVFDLGGDALDDRFAQGFYLCFVSDEGAADFDEGCQLDVS